MPGLAIGRAKLWKYSLDRIAVRESAIRRPEREAVVEGVRRLVLKLQGPVRAAIFRLVNAEVSGVVPGRQEISNSIAHSLHIAELQGFGSRNDSGSPMRTTIGRNDVRASRSPCPDNAGVHRTDGDQQLRRAAMLWSDRGWMTSPCVFCIPGSSDGGNQDDEQQRTLQHRLPPRIGISTGISSVVKYRKAAEAASNKGPESLKVQTLATMKFQQIRIAAGRV